MEAKTAYYHTAAKTVIKNFKKRNIEAIFCEDREAACQAVLDMIPDDSTVSWGGSVTLDEIGVKPALKLRPMTLFDRSEAKSPQEISDIYHQALSADYYLMSSNAITRDGKLVNIDGRGNRLAALIFGPERVVVVAGMNKIVSDEKAALKRVKDWASPINAKRLNRKTPCTKTGFCGDCQSSDCICSQEVVTRRSHVEGRITVVLVGEDLGF